MTWLKKLVREMKRKSWRTSNQDRFHAVFAHEPWPARESVSGAGSDRDSGQVLHALKVLGDVTETYGIRSVADIPCGDFNWIDAYLNQHPDVDYVGYDVVDALIAQNRVRHPEWRFETLDITTTIPTPADLIFCKDMVNHLFERDVWRALKNMAASGSRYLLITSNADYENTDLLLKTPRSSRHLNLQAEPYSFPPPLYGDAYLSLWSLDELTYALSKAPRSDPVCV